MTRNTGDVGHFVTPMTDPIASGWSDDQVALASIEERHLSNGAHPRPLPGLCVDALAQILPDRGNDVS